MRVASCEAEDFRSADARADVQHRHLEAAGQHGPG